MSHGSRVCPACGALNGIKESQCYRCDRPLTGARGGVASFLATPLLATKILLGICFVNFAFLVLDHGGLPMLLLRLGSPPTSSELLRWGAVTNISVEGELPWQEPWRFLSAVFLHIDVLHIAMNTMGALWLCRVTEHRIGGARMVIAFTVTGVLGFVASELWKGSGDPYVTAGASGALFGLMGHEIGQMHIGRDPRTKDVLVQFGANALALALLFPVNNAAHLGGFVAGYIVARLFAFDKRPWRLAPLYQGVAALCIVASIASIVLSERSPVWKQVRAYEVMRGARQK